MSNNEFVTKWYHLPDPLSLRAIPWWIGFMAFMCLFVVFVAIPVTKKSNVRQKYYAEHPTIVEVEGCKYIYTPGSFFDQPKYTHLANCVNPIHKGLQ